MPSCVGEHAGVLFCDGFEDAAFAAWASARTQHGGLVQVADRVHAGAGALRAYTTANGGRAMLISPTFEVPDGEVFFRMFVYFGEEPTTIVASFGFLGESAETENGVAFQVISGDVAQAWVGPVPEWIPSPSGTTLPRGRWSCIEGQVVISDDAGEVRYWVDGELAVEVVGTATRPSGGIDRLIAGVEWSLPMQPPFELWVDDVVAATARVGCASSEPVAGSAVPSTRLARQAAPGIQLGR